LTDAALDSDAKVHFIERDDVERYVVIIQGISSNTAKTVQAYNLETGAAATISQRYRGVIATPDEASSSSRLRADGFYNYTATLTQEPPVSFTATTNGIDEYVRVVDGANISEEKYELLEIDKSAKTVKFKVADPNFALKGDSTGELQNTIDYYIIGGTAPLEVDYLKSKSDGTNTNARKDIKTLTTGDFTYIVNTEAIVAKDTTKSGSLNSNALVFIKQGDYEKKFGVKVEHSSNVYENWVYSGASQANDGEDPPTFYNTAKNAQSDYILETLFSKADNTVKDALGTVNVAPTAPFENRGILKDTSGSLSQSASPFKDGCRLLSPMLGEIRGASGNFTIYPVDSIGGEGIGVAHKAVTSITDLPSVAPHRFKIEVRGDIEENTDDRYVKFLVSGSDDETAAETLGQGSWIECAGDNIENRLDVTTMPLILKSTGVDTFEVNHMPLDPLLAGDANTNPDPSFVGSTIGGVFQFKGRLGFLSDASVSMTEVKFGSYSGDNNIQHYNFYRTSVTTLLDSDAIDVTLSSAHVVKLRDAMAFQDNLVLFSDFGQFVLRGGDLLTPKTVSANPITEYEYERTVSPVAAGSFIYFPFARGEFIGVREFTVNSNTDVFDANEVTAHVPQYIKQKTVSGTPDGLVSMSGCSSEELLALTDGTDIYIYKYFFAGNEKVLSSWSKFTLSEGGVRGLGFVDSDLFIVQSIESTSTPQTHLLKLPLENKYRDKEGYNTHLDRRIEVTFNADAASPSFTVPYLLASGETLQAYTKDGLFVQNLRTQSSGSNTNVTFVDDMVPGGITGTAVKLYVGVSYLMKYTFSRQIFKATGGDKPSPTNAGRMLLRNGSLFFADTAHFTVKVTPDLRSTSKSEFNATVVQSTLEGSMPLETNSFRFPVFTDPKGTTITIENASAAPCNLQSAEFESFIHQRSRRYG
tara:strand:+ start:10061 stop:12835 length:2775 start_codon:yes stop_codon:yes gene_type:complete